MARPSRFIELLQTLGGTRGVFQKFIAGQIDITPGAIFDRMRAVFEPTVGDAELRQVAESMSRSRQAALGFQEAFPDQPFAASNVPITRQLQVPGQPRRRFIADVEVTLDVTIAGQTTSQRVGILVTADRTMTPQQLRQAAIDRAARRIRNKYKFSVSTADAEVTVAWTFRTR